MEKDIAGKNSNDIFFYNENSTIKKYITDYSDKILHASSPFIAIKNKKASTTKSMFHSFQREEANTIGYSKRLSTEQN